MQRAYLYLLLTNLFWSGNFIIGRATHASIGPLTLSSGRWLLVAILLSPFAYKVVSDRKLNLREWLKLSFLALIAVGIYNTFIYIGLQYTAAPNGVLYNSTIPFYIILINWLIFNKSLGIRETLGILLSATGVIFLVSKGQASILFNFEFSQGDLWIIIATSMWGLYTALLPHWRPKQLSGLEFLSILALVGIIPLLIARIINPFNEIAFSWTGQNLIAVIYVGVAASIGAWFCFNEGVKLIGPEKAGQSIHLMPVFVSIMAYFFLDEKLHTYHFIGAGLILAGLLAANKLALFNREQLKD